MKPIITHYCPKEFRVSGETTSVCWLSNPAKITDRWDRVTCKKCIKRKAGLQQMRDKQ